MTPSDPLDSSPSPFAGPDDAAMDVVAAAPLRSRRPWAASEGLAWLMILVSVVAAVWFTVMSKRIAAAAEPGGTAGEIELVTAARYAVGVQEITRQAGMGSATAAATLSADVRPLLDQLDKTAQTPTDRLRAATVHGALEGKAAALERLDEVAENNPGLQADIDDFRALYAADAPPPETWTRLYDKYGWFAQLAAGTGKPDDNPQRAAARAAAVRTVLALVATSAGGLAAIVAGAIVLVVLLVRLYRGRIAPAFDRPVAVADGRVVPGVTLPRDRRAYVMGFALYMVGMLSFGVILRSIFHLPVSWSRGSLFLAFFAGALWPLFQRQTFAQWRAVVGLRAPRGVLREIFAGWLGYLAGMPVVAIGMVLVWLLTKMSGADASHPIIEQLRGDHSALLIAFLLASVWAPLTEELMFRGMLFAHLRERFPWWIAAPIVALIFAIIHPQGWAAVPALAALALVFAAIREWRGSIIGCIAAHALHNTILLVLATMMLA